MQNRTVLLLLLLIPSLGLAGLVLLYPLYDVIHMSFSEVNRFGQVRGLIGISNFRDVFADPIFWIAARNTCYWVLGIVAGTILVSLPVAIILNQEFAGRSVARTLVMLPWSVSLSMIAIVWLWALDGEIGYVGKLLSDLGLGSLYGHWLSKPDTAFVVMILIGIFVSIPFTVTVLLGGLSSLPDDVYEAAALEGASSWYAFRKITRPLLMPFVEIVVVLNVINVFNSFPIIWIMTAGGPSDRTHILVTYLYQLAFRLGEIGKASAISLIMLSILLVLVVVYVRIVTKGRSDA